VEQEVLNLELNQPGYVPAPIRARVSDLHYPQLMPVEDEPLRTFANLIREAREALGWSQDELADAAGVSRPTINRYEQAKTKTPEPETVRSIFLALRLDPRRIPVILGYVTAEEMGLPPEPARTFAPSVEEVIAILEDPTVDSREKAEWVEFLRYRAKRPDGPETRRKAV
jgi:transcriptional regulator with XRE-family HTH domain